MNILILDDDVNIGELVGEVVSALGNNVFVFDQIGPALRSMVKDKIDACIVDFKLNGDDITGNDVLGFIKKHQPIPCMLMTGSLFVGQENELEKNWDILLNKPFNVTIFERTFNDLVKNIKTGDFNER